MKTALAVLLALTPISALADEYQAGYSSSKSCYRSEYREEYVPGTEDAPGYVRSWKETIEFPCERNRATITRPTRTVVERHYEVDNNDCTDGKIAGGLLGGAAGAALSRGDGRWWAIPLGVVAGSAIGCDAAGG
tara:strand:- start:1320 stop:1721 length:402 start_codon:yes stop_codon:yes gene_type:complete